MWHDYHTKNAKFYGKTQKDLNCEGLLAEAKEKGPIKTIPEIPGVLVYMKGVCRIKDATSPIKGSVSPSLKYILVFGFLYCK